MSLLDDEKLFYERFWALHRNADLLAVFKEFGIGVFRRSSVLEGFEDFLRENDFRGSRCVEIGTLTGLTAIVLSRFFERVVTIDVVPNDFKRRIAAHCGVQNIEFVDVRDNAEKAYVINSLQTFDAAYVDGDHARDTETDFELVRRCGRVLLHEYWPAQPAVKRLVDGFQPPARVVSRNKLALWYA